MLFQDFALSPRQFHPGCPKEDAPEQPEWSPTWGECRREVRLKPIVSSPEDHRSPSERAKTAAHNLSMDLVTAEVVTALDAAGVKSILLKGPSVARWLYDGPGLRAYADCDLLVAPSDIPRAERVLRDLRFALEPAPAGVEEVEVEHVWKRADGTTVDLHRRLWFFDDDPVRAWSLLSGKTEPLFVGGRDVEVLREDARALHIALHALQHAIEGTKARHDLSRAIARLTSSLWLEATKLARELGVDEALGAGLRMVDGGEAVARLAGLPETESMSVALRTEANSRFDLEYALALGQLAGLGPTQRMRVLARRLVPPRAYMRSWAAHVGGRKMGLMRAYLYRPLWIARHALSTVGLIRRSRRRAGH